MSAEVIKIEIPVEVQDNTGAGISSITGNLNRLSQSANRVSRSLGTGTFGRTTGFDRSLDKLNKTLSKPHKVEIGLDDNATPGIHNVEDELSRVAGMSATAEIHAHDVATEEIANATDALAQYDGNTGTSELGADDNATEVIHEAEDALSQYNGSSGTAEVDVDDNGTEVIHEAEDALSQFDGDSATAEISVDDNATEVINSAISAGESFDGQHWTAQIDASGFENQLKSGGSSLKGMAMGAAAFAGVSFGIGDAINTFKDFESGMSQVEAISGATGSEMAQLTAKAKELGATTKFTATEAAEGFKYMAMAGWKSDAMLGGIKGIMDLAAASGESLGTTSDIVTDALTAFGLSSGDATHFADVMAQASSNANTNVSMLGESFKYVAPLAGAMNYTIEDTALALGLMANAGVKSSMAGTSLRSAIANLSAPTKQMKTAMDKYGISLDDGTGKMKSLRGVLENTRKSLRGLSEDEQTAAVKDIFGKNALSGMMAIINASDEDWAKLADAVDNADGAAARMAEIMMDNLAGSITLLQSAYEGVQDTFGERLAPYARGIVDALTGSMPEVSRAIDGVMDKVDLMADKFQTTMQKMLSSEEWQNADFIGKIDIAWDNLIAKPFSEWASGEGLNTVSGVVTELFTNAFKILPGGEAPGLSSWLSAGLIGFGALKLGGLAADITKVATAVGELAGADSILGGFASAIGGVAGPALAAAAGIGVLALAIQHYNQQEIETNLADHFGNISLTHEQTTELAQQILDIPFTANLKAATVQLDKATDLISKAEEALKENNKINWKVNSLHLDLSDADKSTLIENKDTFLQNISDALFEKEYGAESAMTSIFGPAIGGIFTREMQKWFTEDNLKVEGLKKAISGIMEKALTEGTYDVNAAAAIQIMQQKMLQIVNASREARQRAELDYLQLTANGAALDPESWKNVVTEMNLMRENMQMDDKAGYISLLEYFETAQLNGHINEDQKQAIMNMIQRSINTAEQRALANEWGWISESLNTAYGDELRTALGDKETGDIGTVGRDAQKRLSTIMDNLNTGVPLSETSIEDTFRNLQNGLTPATTAALSDRYDTVKPVVKDMESLIDKANETGQAVPETLYSAYKDAMSLGAAAGDMDAIYGYMANQLFESGEYDNFMKAVEASGTHLPEAFSAALERAANTKTAADADFSEMWKGLEDAFLEDGTIDLNKVDAWMKEFGQTISDYVSEHGAETTKKEMGQNMGDMLGSLKSIEGLTAEGVSDGIAQYHIDEETNLTKIAKELGAQTEEEVNDYIGQIMDANQDNPAVHDVNTIDAGGTLNIPENLATTAVTAPVEVTPEVKEITETGQISDALSAALEATDSSAEVTADGITIKLGEVQTDEASAAEQVATALGMSLENLSALTGKSQTELEAGGITITISTPEVDTSQAEETVQESMEDLGNETTKDVETTATVNTKCTKGTTDPGDAYSGVSEDAQKLFADPIPVDVTIDATFGKGAANNLSETFTAFETDAKTQFTTHISAASVIDATFGKGQGQNLSAVYSNFETDAKNAFATHMRVDAFIDVNFHKGGSEGADDIASEGMTDINTEATGTVNAQFEKGAAEGLDGVYEEFQNDVQEAFRSAEFTASGMINADQLQKGTDNIAQVYDEVAQAVQEQFNNPISAHGTVNITLSWNITNPTASISVGVSGGTATATIASAGMAEGGFLDSAHIIEAGEDGPEYIVPVGTKHRNRGLELWAAAGKALGVSGYAEGGKIGVDAPVALAANAFSGEGDKGETTQSENNINISVNPSIVINGGDGQSSKVQADEIADEIAEAIAQRLDAVFSNYPESA